ncbi:MAG: phosphatidate cytidylyltransferase, partial [Gammaproteobacteria bacterium]
SKVKDCGYILHCHGGILDRLDSVLAVMPIAALGYYIYVVYIF